MKKFFVMTLLFFAAAGIAMAQTKKAEITFDKTVYDFGKFSEKEPVQKCVFTFTNTGEAPLIINQAIASCGCTVPSYTKEPIKPGGKGQIKVTYNGKGTFPKQFKKSITIRSNATSEMVRLYIEGEMVAEEK